MEISNKINDSEHLLDFKVINNQEDHNKVNIILHDLRDLEITLEERFADGLSINDLYDRLPEMNFINEANISIIDNNNIYGYFYTTNEKDEEFEYEVDSELNSMFGRIVLHHVEDILTCKFEDAGININVQIERIEVDKSNNLLRIFFEDESYYN
jgi:hypothetical protein